MVVKRASKFLSKLLGRIHDASSVNEMTDAIVKIPYYFHNTRVWRFIRNEAQGKETRQQETNYWSLSVPVPTQEEHRPIWVEVLQEHSRNYCLGLEKEDLKKFQDSINAFFEALGRAANITLNKQQFVR